MADKDQYGFMEDKSALPDDDQTNASLTAMQNQRSSEDPSTPMVARMTASMKAMDAELGNAAADLKNPPR